MTQDLAHSDNASSQRCLDALNKMSRRIKQMRTLVAVGGAGSALVQLLTKCLDKAWLCTRVIKPPAATKTPN
jgi:putative AlgH/UPF0301 family transcriptional regulator